MLTSRVRQPISGKRTVAVRIFLPSVLFLFLVLATFPEYAQNPKTNEVPIDQDDVIKVSTTLVTVPVSVMDRNGRFITDLDKQQFHIFEDGVEQEIAFFENADAPFTVALLLDVSDSTKQRLGQIKDAALAFINELRADDRIMLVTFDKRITVLCDPTNDRAAIQSVIGRIQSGGGTSLYDTIDLVASHSLRRVRGRKAIVMFTDGVDTTSRLATYEGTLRAAEELDALIYTIRYNTYDDLTKTQTTSFIPGQQPPQLVTSKGEPLDVAYKRAANYLQLLSDKSAGRFFYAASLSQLTGIFGRIAQELRERYSLGYYPSNKSEAKKRREVRVRLAIPNVAIHCRHTYIYTLR